ncbi:MAG: heavy-metal-associated domain-containing protein [Clostridiales bacterium]|jgi:cation transport ATPase|nr:heavy-metal-associated domain-containing protein [Clostridiales bacterium]
MKTIFRVKNLDCADCAAKMQTAVSKMPGVQGCSVNFLTQKMTVETDEALSDASVKDMQKTMRKVESGIELLKM